MDRYTLYDFLDHRLNNGILQWVRDEKITVRDRAALNQKIRRLAQMEYELAIQTKLLAGPIFKHIYKLKVHGNVMLRPMLCRGPIYNAEEYTFLVGSVETGDKLPVGCKEKAESNRLVVLNDPNRRCPHQRNP